MPADESADRAADHSEADANPRHRGRKVFDGEKDLDRVPGCDDCDEGYLQLEHQEALVWFSFMVSSSCPTQLHE